MRALHVILMSGLLWSTAGGVVTGQGKAATVLVSAASSLAGVMETVARQYETRYQERISLNVGASNTLARQIRAGARVDVFLSADEAQMDAVGHLIVPSTRIRLLGNQLAIAVPSDRPQLVASAADLTAAGVRRVVMGDPDAVPVGVYARAYLQRIGLWTVLRPKMVPVGSARLALAAVERGAAEAAIVYRTDLIGSRDARLAYLVPLEDTPAISYPAAVVQRGQNRAGAERFLRFLQQPEATAVFVRAGFVALVPAAPPRAVSGTASRP